MTNKECEERVDLVIHKIQVVLLLLVVGIVIGILVVGLINAFAQAATEQFIPIGFSPGLSQEGQTVLGLVETLRGRTLTIIPVAPLEVLRLNGTLQVPPSGRRVIRLTRSTVIYLDRSKVQRANTRGTLADLQRHRLVEVYRDQWVKVRVE